MQQAHGYGNPHGGFGKLQVVSGRPSSSLERIGLGVKSLDYGQVISEDFDPKQSREFFKRELDSGKAFVMNIREELQMNKTQQSETEKMPEAEKTVPFS